MAGLSVNKTEPSDYSKLHFEVTSSKSETLKPVAQLRRLRLLLSCSLGIRGAAYSS